MLTFKGNLVDKINDKLSNDKVLVLDFDDGVGPFSDAATCTLDVSFNLIVTDEGNVTSDFDKTIKSNLGDVHVKGYAENILGNSMTLTQDKYLRNILSSEGGLIDSNVLIRA